jgi:hypothetical protein
MLNFKRQINPVISCVQKSARYFAGYTYKGNGVIGVVKEDFSMWERRCPICPHHVQDLKSQG